MLFYLFGLSLSFIIFGPNMGSGRPGRYLKSFLEAVRFIVTHYRPVGSHGDPIHGQKYGFGTQHMCCVESPDTCCVETQDMCCVETPDMCCVERPDMCCLGRPDMCCLGRPDMCCLGRRDMCCLGRPQCAALVDHNVLSW